ncbi:hypothetical protein OF83DRAFT_1179209 [Amylostereum chailletii]|nr:hypothetical protein OF83DRAFT_1179209 [Amylostereum chailletii]
MVTPQLTCSRHADVHSGMRIQNKSRIYRQGKLHNLEGRPAPYPTSDLSVFRQAVAGRRGGQTRAPGIHPSAPAHTPLVLTRSPTPRLPDELLHVIFDALVADAPPSSLTGRRGARPLGVTLSHVCRRWHAVAYRHPRLWTRLPLFHIHFTDLALHNAVVRGRPGDPVRPLPISIAAEWGSDRASWPAHPALRPALHALERVAALSLVALSPDPAAFRAIRDVTDLLFSRAAPTLQSFRIHVRKRPGEHALTLSACLFRGQTHRLRRLDMSHVSILPTAEILQVDLTSLVLDCALVWADTDDFLEGLLCLSASLQDLVLYHPPGHWKDHRVDPDTIWPSSPCPGPPHSIPFPRLRTAHFDDHVSRLPSLLQHLFFPPGARLSLRLAVVGAESGPAFVLDTLRGSYDGLLHAVADIYTGFPWSDRIACQRAAVEQLPRALKVTPVLCDGIAHLFPRVALQLYWAEPLPPPALACLTADLLRLFPGMHVARELALHDAFIPASPAAAAAAALLDLNLRLPAANNIARLRLHRAAVPAFAAAQALQAGGAPLFPSLRELVLADFDVDAGARADGDVLRGLGQALAARFPPVCVTCAGAVGRGALPMPGFEGTPVSTGGCGDGGAAVPVGDGWARAT